MKARRYVGREFPRPEAPDKTTGRALYIHDVVRPGMLTGKILHAGRAHARIKRIDVSKAAALPGVAAVITGFDTPEIRVGFLGDNRALKRDKVRNHRDEVAAVAAVDEETARRALELIEVEYEDLPAVFDPEEALAPGAPLVHETRPDGSPADSNLVPLEVGHHTGDLEAARAASAFRAEGEYRLPWIQQACMGTAGCIAEFGAGGDLTVWAKTQIPFLAQRDFNRALEAMGLEGRNTRVVVVTLGGGFGTGLDTHCYEYIAILLAWRTGRPVKIVYDREEEFACLSPRQCARIRIEQGCDRDGRLTYRKIDVLQDNGAYASWGATYPTVMLLPATSLYKVPVVHFDARIVYTNNTYAQAMRGYGNPEVTFAIESNLDDLAARAGIDPLEIRRRNCNEPGEVTPMGAKVGSCGLAECLAACAERIDFSSGRTPDGRLRGAGIAAFVHVGGSGRIYRSDASGIILKLDDFGNVDVRYGGVEMGQGLHATIRLAVAEALGVEPDAVRVDQADTATCPWDVGTHASRGAFMAGNAAIQAARKLRARLFARSAEVLPDMIRRRLAELEKTGRSFAPPPADFEELCRPEALELAGGVLFLRDFAGEPWARFPLPKVLRRIHFRRGGEMFTESAFYDPPSDLPDWSQGRGNMSAAYTYGAQACSLLVDPKTGEVEIERFACAMDVGTVLNPQGLEGQVIGGLVQGIGYALYEEVLTREGRILNPNFTDYKLPTTCETAFPIDLVFVDTEEESGPFGAKGAGEPGLVPTAPAIRNAIRAALGVELRELPMTPERILRALEART